MGFLCMYLFTLILLQTFLGMSWTYIIVITSRRGWCIVRVGTMIVYCSCCCFQYQLVFSCMEQIYFALKINSSAEITCPSIVVLFCSVYASDRNWMTYHPFFVVSYLLMAPYIPYLTNESMFSLFPSRTTLCISSNASKGVDSGVSSMIFQFLYDPRTGQ